jgi:hypothetical protein
VTAPEPPGHRGSMASFSSLASMSVTDSRTAIGHGKRQVWGLSGIALGGGSRAERWPLAGSGQ